MTLCCFSLYRSEIKYYCSHIGFYKGNWSCTVSETDCCCFQVLDLEHISEMLTSLYSSLLSLSPGSNCNILNVQQICLKRFHINSRLWNADLFNSGFDMQLNDARNIC